MAGTVAGGKKAAATNKFRYGLNFYEYIGHLGGIAAYKNHGPRGFALNRERARRAGRKGGQANRVRNPWTWRTCVLCLNQFWGVRANRCHSCLSRESNLKRRLARRAGQT